MYQPSSMFEAAEIELKPKQNPMMRFFETPCINIEIKGKILRFTFFFDI